MNKAHVTILALLFAGAAVLGSIAVTRTTGLGHAAQQTSDGAVAARTRQLNAYAAKLQKELAAKPPALPKIPTQPPAAAPAPAPRVVYHQPPPVVVTVHRQHGDDGSREAEGGAGGRDD
jgi:hypothetical protein